MEKKLNLDIAGAITEFEGLMKEFLIRRVMYKIIFRGKGLEFDSYRYFAPDDDAGDIDWKASQRAGKLLVKQYIEERDLKIMFVVDISDNMLFGSTEKLKCEYAAEISAALSHLILNYGDKVGFVLFSDKIIKSIMPGKERNQFEMFVNDLSNPFLYGGVSEIEKTIDFLLEYLDESINAVIIVSDFIRMKKEILRKLNLISGRIETMAIMVKDPLDKTMPDTKEEMVIEDSVTKDQIVIDPSIVKKAYEKNALEQENTVKKVFSDSGVDFIELTTEKPFATPLSEFLKERIEKRKFITPMR